MNLNYFDLLSPSPIKLKDIGSIKAVKLKEIDAIGYSNYEIYLGMLSMTPQRYYNQTGQSEYFDSLDTEQKLSIHLFDLIAADEQLVGLIELALGFFFVDYVRYSSKQQVFLTFNGSKDANDNLIVTGVINRNVWSEVCDIIMQRNFIQNNIEDYSNVKSSKAKKILEKLMAGRKKKQENAAKTNPDVEFGNVISVVASLSVNTNLIDIWDFTVYQLWDSYMRLKINVMFDIQKTSVSVWGDKDKHFDPDACFKNIRTKQ